jgi:hypothetical protein
VTLCGGFFWFFEDTVFSAAAAHLYLQLNTCFLVAKLLFAALNICGGWQSHFRCFTLATILA